jgi:hypothetical protein
MAAFGMRNIPLWLIASLFPTIQCLDLLKKDVAKYADGDKRLSFVYVISLIILCFYGLVRVWSYDFTVSLQVNSVYPVKAVKFLENNPKKGELFSVYDWGGYLVWKLPDKKVFIDGRMPSWRWQSPDKKFSNNAFKEYLNIFSGKENFEKSAKKYHINTVLISKKTLQGFSQKKINNPFGFMKKIYDDELAVIYEK